MVVLDELFSDSHLNKLVATVGLHKEPAIVAMRFGDDADDAFKHGRDRLHGWGEADSRLAAYCFVGGRQSMRSIPSFRARSMPRTARLGTGAALGYSDWEIASK